MLWNDQKPSLNLDWTLFIENVVLLISYCFYESWILNVFLVCLCPPPDFYCFFKECKSHRRVSNTDFPSYSAANTCTYMIAEMLLPERQIPIPNTFKTANTPLLLTSAVQLFRCVTQADMGLLDQIWGNQNRLSWNYLCEVAYCYFQMVFKERSSVLFLFENYLGEFIALLSLSRFKSWDNVYFRWKHKCFQSATKAFLNHWVWQLESDR